MIKELGMKEIKAKCKILVKNKYFTFFLFALITIGIVLVISILAKSLGIR
jgi:hypothetical protein